MELLEERLVRAGAQGTAVDMLHEEMTLPSGGCLAGWISSASAAPTERRLCQAGKDPL